MTGIDTTVSKNPDDRPAGRRPQRSSGSAARKRGTPERRAELLNVAVRIFYEKGYAETTLQDIADAMGFTKPAIYYYAKNKEELLVELYGQIVTSSIEGAREIAQGEGTGSQRLMALVERHLTTFLANIEANAVFEVQRRSLSPSAKRRIQKWAREYTEILSGVYEEGVADGSLMPVPSGIAVNALVGMLNSVHRWYRPDGAESRQELVAQLSDIVARGLVRSDA